MRLPITILLITLSSTAAQAQVCEPNQIQNALLEARRLSFDLLGHAPEPAILEQVVNATAVDEQIVDNMIASDAFRARIRGFVEDLLWANIRQNFQQGSYSLIGPMQPYQGITTPAWWLPLRSVGYRGGNGTVTCKDEPATFDANGNLETTPGPLAGSVQEGWVELEPYWAPGTTIRVCGFDAQDTTLSTAGADCSVGNQGRGDTECACGPNLRYCQGLDIPSGVNTGAALNDAVIEQALRMVDRILVEGRPYSDLILGEDIEVNGVLVHYLNHQTGTAQGALFTGPDQGLILPNLAYLDDWTAVTREEGYGHAGILTSLLYLLKYQSDRARTNRFYNAFLCQYLDAPLEGLPSPSDPCNDEPNLTKRCGCKFCHQVLDRDAAYFGRWAERGILPLLEAEYPSYDADCATPPFSKRCRDFYFTEANHPDQQPYLGWLKPYVFADEFTANIDAGPRGLAEGAVSSGRFAECTVEKLWSNLLNRAPNADDREAIEVLAQGFAAQQYDLGWLVKNLVQRSEYTEARHCTEEVTP